MTKCGLAPEATRSVTRRSSLHTEVRISTIIYRRFIIIVSAKIRLLAGTKYRERIIIIIKSIIIIYSLGNHLCCYSSFTFAFASHQCSHTHLLLMFDSVESVL